jgi:NAD(P)-dependent dehydrogenase (short-subunit alcohol dehydrogenase family)
MGFSAPTRSNTVGAENVICRAQAASHPAESYVGLGAQLPPVGHVGQVRVIVNGILFLESSPFITGELLHIDGGQIAGN